jgi:hypothetical protein
MARQTQQYETNAVQLRNQCLEKGKLTSDVVENANDTQKSRKS